MYKDYSGKRNSDSKSKMMIWIASKGCKICTFLKTIFTAQPKSFNLLQYNRESPGFETNDKCSDVLSVQYFVFFPLNTLLCCSWLLWNREAKQFIIRKVYTAELPIFNRRTKRTSPTHTPRSILLSELKPETMERVSQHIEPTEGLDDRFFLDNQRGEINSGNCHRRKDMIGVGALPDVVE